MAGRRQGGKDGRRESHVEKPPPSSAHRAGCSGKHREDRLNGSLRQEGPGALIHQFQLSCPVTDPVCSWETPEARSRDTHSGTGCRKGGLREELVRGMGPRKGCGEETKNWKPGGWPQGAGNLRPGVSAGTARCLIPSSPARRAQTDGLSWAADRPV